MSKPKLYVGCSLTQAPKEFITSVENLKLELAKHFEILDFIGLTGKTSQEVYQHDRKCVLNSDLFLAICDFPSTCLGMEIGFALENNKKIVLAFHQNSKITRMLLGIPSDQVKQLEYNNLEEITTFLTKK